MSITRQKWNEEKRRKINWWRKQTSRRFSRYWMCDKNQFGALAALRIKYFMLCALLFHFIHCILSWPVLHIAMISFNVNNQFYFFFFVKTHMVTTSSESHIYFTAFRFLDCFSLCLLRFLFSFLLLLARACTCYMCFSFEYHRCCRYSCDTN